MRRLVELSDGYDLVIPFVGGYHHPLAALYRRHTVLPAIESLLNEDRRRLSSLIDAVKTRVVGESEMRAVDPKLQTLRNLNSPEDYEGRFAMAVYPRAMPRIIRSNWHNTPRSPALSEPHQRPR